MIFAVSLTYGIVFAAVFSEDDGTETSGIHDQSVGESSYGICWIHNVDTRRKSSEEQRVNHSNVYFIYLPVFVVLVTALISQMFVWRALRAGLPRTLQSRMKVLRKSMKFVLIYLLYYTMLSAVIYINYASRQCWDSSSIMFEMLHWLYGGRGAVTLFGWLLLFDVRSILCTQSGPTHGKEADTNTSARLNYAIQRWECALERELKKGFVALQCSTTSISSPCRGGIGTMKRVDRKRLLHSLAVLRRMNAIALGAWTE